MDDEATAPHAVTDAWLHPLLTQRRMIFPWQKLALHPASAAAPARSRGKKFLSYYKPYVGLFFADMVCALLVSAIKLLLPLCARYITKNILEGNTPHALNHIYLMGALMLALVGVHTLCTMFIDFQGHMMGAKMESDMRQQIPY